MSYVRQLAYGNHFLGYCIDDCAYIAVVFMGRHQMKESLKWMGAFWLSIAGMSLTSLADAHEFSKCLAPLLHATWPYKQQSVQTCL